MLWNTILLAMREIRRNLLRSSLTMLGIVIGVASVIVMVNLGSGATRQVSEQIASLGSNLLTVRPGQRLGFGQRSEAAAFDIDDARAIADEIAGVAAAAPAASQATTAIYGNRNWSTTVTGSENNYLEVGNWSLASGREFSPGDLHSGAAACILGDVVRKELFGNLNPLGEKIRLNKLTCQVIGLLAPKGQALGGHVQDDLILVPLRTFWRRIAGKQDVQSIYVSARDDASTSKVQREIELLLRERRRIAADEDDDFNVRDLREIADALTGTTRVLTTLLGTVAAVSLVVGGIGIMNIMLVSVTERTREIGIRLAIGALERDVLMQFLVEAVVLSSLGGIIGIVIAVAATYLLSALMRSPVVLDGGIMLVAFLFSAAVGVIFGFFPARKAARLDPIEALRYE
ncbi:MAG TPA: ABC transporter permease [Gammaproteobacteria bacterium]|nr:ABC transporter permease [Gammaproteobacteria bacterium]